MSKNFEDKELSFEEQDGEKKKMEALHKLLDTIANDPDAPDGLAELLKSMYDDPNLHSLLQKNAEDIQRKEDLATDYANQIRAFLDSKQWHYTTMDKNGRAMLLGFKMQNSTVRLQIIIESVAECIRFNVSMLSCQDEYRLAMSDYLVQLNKPLRYGAFHLDNDDGEVTYRYSVSYRGLPFSEESFENYIEACIITVDQNSKEIGKIAYGKFNDEEKKEWFKRIKQLAVALSQ